MTSKVADCMKEFDEITAEYFSLLYQSFPFEIHLSPIATEAEHYISVTLDDREPLASVQDQVQVARERITRSLATVPLRDATLSWLYQTGYFIAQTVTSESSEGKISFVTTEGIPTRGHVSGEPISDIYLGSHSFTSYQKARLSPKGFEALRAALQGELANELGVQKSLGTILSEEAKKAGSETRSQVYSRVIGEVIGHAMKSFGG